MFKEAGALFCYCVIKLDRAVGSLGSRKGQEEKSPENMVKRSQRMPTSLNLSLYLSELKPDHENYVGICVASAT